MREKRRRGGGGQGRNYARDGEEKPGTQKWRSEKEREMIYFSSSTTVRLHA